MTDWHSMDIKAVRMNRLRRTGLSADEVPEDGKVRRQYAGDHRGISPLKLLLKQVNNPLIYLLTGAAALSFATGHSIDAAVIGAVIILNTILGAVQELKADRALEALHRMAAPHAEVLRDGETVTVPSGEIVPGDVLLLRTGHRVPADAGCSSHLSSMWMNPPSPERANRFTRHRIPLTPMHSPRTEGTWSGCPRR